MITQAAEWGPSAAIFKPGRLVATLGIICKVLDQIARSIVTRHDDTHWIVAELHPFKGMPGSTESPPDQRLNDHLFGELTRTLRH